LPCYFIPAKKGKVCPVIFLVTGGEGSNFEMYSWGGDYALKNGYSVFLYEGPGNFSTMYTSGLTMMFNSEVPIGKALDILCSRQDVDTEYIAMLGISFGGYLVASAAIFDNRIKAIIPTSPLTNIHKMLISVLPSYIFKLPDWLLNFFKKYVMSYSDRATLDLLLWEGGTLRLLKTE
jgi:dipeptidyl aminopeptidase/acylaminoacyl peptidase